jgi:hypothetical protein
MANCLITEAQVFEAALTSTKVKPWVLTEEKGDDTDTVAFNCDPKGRAL